MPRAEITLAKFFFLSSSWGCNPPDAGDGVAGAGGIGEGDPRGGGGDGELRGGERAGEGEGSTGDGVLLLGLGGGFCGRGFPRLMRMRMSAPVAAGLMYVVGSFKA